MVREDLVLKRAREQASRRKRQLLELQKGLDSLETQYKQVIDELRRQVRELTDNAPKAFVIYLINLIKRKKVKK